MSFARVRALVAVGLLAVLALVFVVVALVRDTQSNAGIAEGCPDDWPRANITLPERKDVKIKVLNGTDRPGLAAVIGDDFRNRDFQVVSHANSKKKIDAVAVLRFGPQGVGSAHLLQAYFLGRAKLEYNPSYDDADVVKVVLGNQFQQLATTTEVNQSLGDLGAPVAPPGSCPVVNEK